MNIITKTTSTNFWSDYTIQNNFGILLISPIIRLMISNFWEEKVNSISNDEHILFIFRVQYNNSIIRTIGVLKRLNKDDMKYAIDYIINEVSLVELEEERATYTSKVEDEEKIIVKLIINYCIRAGAAPVRVRINANNQNEIKVKELNHMFYCNYKLPLVMNPIEYGNLIYKLSSNGFNIFIVQYSKTNVAKIEVRESVDSIFNKVAIFKDGIFRFEFTDTQHKSNLNKFYLIIGENQYTIENGKLLNLKLK